ncbi:MAG: universal stress protein [Actinomycetaceae bacterium]|nr:universal stress protein [Actinomycetaceae bacterium]
MTDAQVQGYGRILVGTDGSSLAGPTVVRAATLAKAHGADVVIICAYTTLSSRDSASQEGSPAQVATLGQVPGSATATKALEEAVAIVESHGVKVAAALLVDGEPASALLESAKQYEVDALVLGAIRDTSIAGRLLGTVASEVVRRAHRDVLIVRPVEGAAEPNVAEDVAGLKVEGAAESADAGA